MSYHPKRSSVCKAGDLSVVRNEPLTPVRRDCKFAIEVVSSKTDARLHTQKGCPVSALPSARFLRSYRGTIDRHGRRDRFLLRFASADLYREGRDTMPRGFHVVLHAVGLAGGLRAQAPIHIRQKPGMFDLDGAFTSLAQHPGIARIRGFIHLVAAGFAGLPAIHNQAAADPGGEPELHDRAELRLSENWMRLPRLAAVVG